LLFSGMRYPVVCLWSLPWEPQISHCPWFLPAINKGEVAVGHFQTREDGIEECDEVTLNMPLQWHRQEEERSHYLPSLPPYSE
jgi:hypothetical protein